MIIFKNQKAWVNAMKKAAKYNTAYCNQPGYNLMYWTGEKLLVDCINFPKALFNGGDPYNLKMGPNCGIFPANTGDVDGYGLIQQCTHVSSDFTKLKEGYPEVMWMDVDGHMGNYIGQEVVRNGYIYNTIEATAWEGDFQTSGIIYSYVDEYGRRLNHKGGYQCFTWKLHGRPSKWVKYVPVNNGIKSFGEWGTKTTKIAQKVFGTTKDGVISGQKKKYKKLCPNCLSASWKWDDGNGSELITAIQKWAGIKVSGQCGPKTILAIQKKLKVKETGELDKKTVTAFQKFLNKKL